MSRKSIPAICGCAAILAFAVAGITVAPYARTLAEDGAGENAANVRYEAEDGAILHAEKKGKGCHADYGKYSGSGFVGGIDYADSKVEFTVTVQTDGEYELTVCYSTKVKGSSFNVYNDAGLFATLKCSYVSDWGCFDVTPAVTGSVSLREGENKVSIGRGIGFAELDYIEIGARLGDYRESGVTDNDVTKPTPGFTRYEAENGVITDGVTYSTGKFSGVGYVGNLDYSASNVAFEVNVESDGEYEIGVAYAIDSSYSAATLRIFNDAGFYTSVRCPVLLGWGEFSKEAIAQGKISLKAGKNSVSVWKGQNFAQIDFIEIGAKTGDYKQAGSETGKAPAAAEGYVRYEAEEGMVFNASKKGAGFLNDYGNSYYSGRGFVGSMNDDTCYIDLPVKVDEDGTYKMILRYSTAMDGAKIQILTGTYGRDAVISRYADYFCEHVAEDWGIFDEEGTVTFSVGLKAGQFIRIKGTYAEIDYIDLGAKTGEYTAGTIVSESVNDAFGEDNDEYVPAKNERKKGCSGVAGGGFVTAALLAASAFAINKKDKEIKHL